MTTAIMLRGARNVLLDNVVIRGFERGIVAENSSLLMNRVRAVNGGIGVLLRRSYANILNSQVYGNLIDVLTEESDVNIINSIALKIIAYLSNVSISHYAVNVYELQRLALDVLREHVPENKNLREILGLTYMSGPGDVFVGTHETFTIEIKPPVGAILTVERMIPPAVDYVMNLS